MYLLPKKNKVSGVKQCLGRFLGIKLFYSTNASSSSSITPLKVYDNADSQKLEILLENKGKTGIYMWRNKNGKIYVGSAKDLRKRLTQYYNINYLLKRNTMYINKAILKEGYGVFSVHILEYCSTEDLITREQYYIDILKPEYNILKFANSSTGYKHREDTLENIRGVHNHFYGKTHTEDSRAKMTESKLGDKLSEKTREKIRDSMKGRKFSEEHKANLSAAKINSKKLLVVDLISGAETIFDSIGKAERSLNLPKDSIRANLRSKTKASYKGMYKFKLIEQ